MYKFENLEVWRLSIDCLDDVYGLSEAFPKNEEYGLKSQLRRASVSISLNIAEGSTGQTDSEQARFLGFAIRSFFETVACLRIAERRGYLKSRSRKVAAERVGEKLIRKLQAFRIALAPEKPWARTEGDVYSVGGDYE